MKHIKGKKIPMLQSTHEKWHENENSGKASGDLKRSQEIYFVNSSDKIK